MRTELLLPVPSNNYIIGYVIHEEWIFFLYGTAGHNNNNCVCVHSFGGCNSHTNCDSWLTHVKFIHLLTLIWSVMSLWFHETFPAPECNFHNFLMSVVFRFNTVLNEQKAVLVLEWLFYISLFSSLCTSYFFQEDCSVICTKVI